MSVKESRASKESSASTALALMAAARALKAWWGMGQHVQVSISTLCMCKVYVPQSCQDSSAKMTLHDVKPEQLCWTDNVILPRSHCAEKNKNLNTLNTYKVWIFAHSLQISSKRFVKSGVQSWDLKAKDHKTAWSLHHVNEMITFLTLHRFLRRSKMIRFSKITL